MRSVSRLALACAIASSVVAFGVHGAAAAPITDPTGTVSVATDGSCAQTGFGVAVSTTGCANGTVAVSGTGQAFGGVAVSGTGQAVTDSDLTPVAVSGTGNAAGSGDMGAYTVSGLGTATGSNGVDVAGGNACGTGANVEISVFGSTCGAPISVCVTCHVPAAHLDWYHQGLRRF
jgi:hypothetical protein